MKKQTRSITRPTRIHSSLSCQWHEEEGEGCAHCPPCKSLSSHPQLTLLKSFCSRVALAMWLQASTQARISGPASSRLWQKSWALPLSRPRPTSSGASTAGTSESPATWHVAQPRGEVPIPRGHSPIFSSTVFISPSLSFCFSKSSSVRAFQSMYSSAFTMSPKELRLRMARGGPDVSSGMCMPR